MTNWKVIDIRQVGRSAPIPAVGQIITEDWNRVAAVPWLVHMPEIDRLMILLSTGYPHDPCLITSDDGGDTWTQPRRMLPQGVEMPSTNAGAMGLGLTYLGKGRLVMTFHDLWAHSFSDDYGATWSQPLPFGKAPDGNQWYVWDPMLVDKDAHGNVTRLWEGRATYVNYESRAYICTSVDTGRTWQTHPHVFEDVTELALARAANGNIIAGCRLSPSEEFKGKLDHHEGMGTAVSKDNGKTWSPVQRLYDFGRHHQSFVVLPNGHLVMTYVVRQGYPSTEDGYIQFGIEAVISRDHGETWDMANRYILTTWAANQKGPNAWWASSQCTSSLLLPDGNILTCYATGYRSKANAQNLAEPRDVGLIRWRVE